MMSIRTSCAVTLGLACFSLLPPLCGQTVSPKPAFTKVVEDAAAAGTFSGVVLFSRRGEAAQVVTAGYAGEGQTRAMRPDTVFRLASETKQVTALLVMQEVVAGRLRLDETVQEAWPGAPQAIQAVTLRQLLQHVSGLQNPSDGPENIVPAFYKRSSGKALEAESVAFCAAKPKRAAGGNFEYNNCDYILLGEVLHAATRKTFTALVQERVSTPLGLKSWGVFGVDSPKGPVAMGFMSPGVKEDVQNPATYGAAGALFGNALDLARWDEAVMSYRLLSKEATDEMFTASPKLYGEALGSWAYDLKLGERKIHLIERQGDIGGTMLLNLMIPAEHASLILLSNTAKADLFNTYSEKGLAYVVLQALYAGKN